MAENLYASSHITGDLANPTLAVGAPDTLWAGLVNSNTSATSRYAIADPVDPLTGAATQSVNVLARKGSNSNNPSVAVNLYENGSLVGSLVGTTSITSTTGQTLTGTFNSSEITNPADVEIEVVVTGTGGSPSARNSAQINHIEWVADTTAATPEVLLAGSSDGTSTAAGILTGEVPLVGSSDGTSTAAALLSGDVPLAGTADGTSTGVGDLTVETASSDVLLAGAAAGSSTADGILTGEVPLAGAATGLSTADGVLTGDVPLTATASGSSTATADLTILGAVALVGTAAGTSTAIGGLTGDLALNGTADGSSTASGDLTVVNLNVQLSGIADGASTADGLLVLTVGFVGDAPGTSSALGALTLDSDPPPREWLEASPTGIGLEGSSI